jgi:hypothetical protein
VLEKNQGQRRRTMEMRLKKERKEEELFDEES